MTLEEAVATLNRERHNEVTVWHLEDGEFAGEIAVTGEQGCECCLSPFEAIAIAEKYERERAAPAPDPHAITTKPDPVCAFSLAER